MGEKIPSYASSAEAFGIAVILATATGFLATFWILV